MRHIAVSLLALTLASSLGLAACHKTGSNADRDVSNPGDSAAVNTVQDAAAGPTGMVSSVMANDKADTYVPAAAIGDMYEVEAGKIAAQRAKDPKIKAFGEMMVKDHTATTAGLKAALAASGLTISPPTEMDDRRKGMIQNLRAAGDSDFDLAYLHQQAAAHFEALNLHKGYADKGDNDALKKAAADTAPKVQMHLDHLKDIGGDKLS